MSAVRKAARHELLAELAAVAAELEILDRRHDEERRPKAERRDELLLAARAVDPPLSLRDAAAMGKVSHAWVRKLERRGG